MKALFRKLDSWFFEVGDPRTAAALRIGVCSLYLLLLWDFLPVMPMLFGRRGLMGSTEPVLNHLHGFRYFLFHYDSPVQLRLWFWVTVLVATLGLIGFKTRLSLILTYLSFIWFRERDPFMTFGADLVLNCIGIWLLFLDCG